jgi:hypothetical protein
MVDSEDRAWVIVEAPFFCSSSGGGKLEEDPLSYTIES